jgi:hypothetical protein
MIISKAEIFPSHHPAGDMPDQRWRSHGLIDKPFSRVPERGAAKETRGIANDETRDPLGHVRGYRSATS